MKGTMLTLAVIAAAASAGAQSAQTPAPAATMMAPADAPGHPTAAAATAQKRIELDGYSDVRGLAKGPDGLWHGTASRGGTSVQVTVDRAGNVSAK